MPVARLLTLPILLFFMFAIALTVQCQVPEFGAQVMIPRDKQQIEHLFKTLEDHNMPVARIWTIFDPETPESWDFTYYDYAFDVAHKHGVGICPTLGPIGAGVSRIVQSQDQFDMARRYIEILVKRYKDHPALDTWMLLNEPGMPPAPHPLAVERFRAWLKDKYVSIDNMWGQYGSFDDIEYDPEWEEEPGRDFVDWHTFWRGHLRWSLAWIAAEIRKWDPDNPLHANPHGLINNLAEISYDLPSWMDILNSMGGSMHPSWHFGELLPREQYALGAAYECDLLRGAAEPKHFWITELQGGNNLYRPMYPMSPSDEDIAQFLWTIVGSGGKRVIYWKLDPSSAWSLLDFQGRPSERMETTRDVANVIRNHSDFFADAAPFDSPITLLLSLESMTVQLATHGWKIEAEKDHIGRSKFAHLLSTLGYYKAFIEMGIPVNIKHVHDFGWEAGQEKPQVAILANATALASDQTEQMERFVENGNTLIVSGLTGIYDPYRDFLPTGAFPLQKLFGGRYKEIRLPEIYGDITLSKPDVTVPYHLWVGEIEPFEARVLGKKDGHVIATHNFYGKGQVYWIPSLIGLPAFEKDNVPLMQLLKDWAEPFITASPFAFNTRCPDCVSRILVKDKEYVTTLTNGSLETKECVLLPRDPSLKARLMWGQPGQFARGTNTITLGPRETVVLQWK